MTDASDGFGFYEVGDGFGGGTNTAPVLAGIEEVSQDPNLFVEDDEDVEVDGSLARMVVAAAPTGTASAMIRAMARWLGTTEHPPGSNHNEITVRYNKEVDQIGNGPWCFAAGTLIDTPRGLTPIEDLLVGQTVITPSGAVKPIASVGSRMAEETILVKAQGLHGTRTTHEHPYLTPDGWREAGALVSGDLIGFPVPPERGEVDVDPNVAYMLGSYVADGWRRHRTDSHRSTSVYIQDDASQADRLRKHIELIGCTYTETERKTGVQFEIRGRWFYELCGQFGDGSADKVIAPVVFLWAREAREAFFEGYSLGDGNTTVPNRWQANSRSRRLVYGLAKLLRSLGHSPTVQHQLKSATTVIEGRTVNQNPDVWLVSYTIDPAKKSFRWADGYLWTRVRAVEDADPAEVFNLTVADEHAFIADGAAVHNCDMTITIAGIDSKNSLIVGKYAYTPSHASWFNKIGRWHYGTSGIVPGGVVFFDWGGSRSIGQIDHVGLVERVADGKIYTIEGNTGPGPGQCRRVVRDATYIVGFGKPAYTPPKLVAPGGVPVLKQGSTGSRVEMLQRCLNSELRLHLVADGDFGPLTKKAVIAFQIKVKFKKNDQDGEYGPKTAAAMEKALKVT